MLRLRKKFETLLASLSDATIIIDQDGFVKLFNQQAERLFGYNKDEIIGQSVFEFGLWSEESLRKKLEKRLMKDGIYPNFEADFCQLLRKAHFRKTLYRWC